MYKPKISVVITVYNIEKYIGVCLESVLNQTMKDIEVICVDDASTDNSLDILNTYAKKDERVRIISQTKNSGPATARNVGYKMAQGEYVYQIDGDDYIAEGALERMYTCAKEYNLDFLTFSADAFLDTKEIEKKVFTWLNLYKRTGHYEGVMKGTELFAACIQNGDFLGNMCCIFLNRDFFNESHMYLLDGLYAAEDSPFLFYLNAQRVMCIPDVLYMRRFRENSLVTSELTLFKFENMLIQFVYEMNLWNQREFESFEEDAFEKYFAKYWKKILEDYGSIVDRNHDLKLLPKYKLAKFIFDYQIRKSNVYWMKQTGEMLEEIRKYENVIIYGAKNIGKEVRNVLEENRIFNYVFAVSDNKNEKENGEQKIYNIDELTDMKENSIVILAISKRHLGAVKEKLQSLGFKNLLAVE
ncbi:glycosyltransferase [Lachnospiraceae bacterium 47-T17]